MRGVFDLLGFTHSFISLGASSSQGVAGIQVQSETSPGGGHPQPCSLLSESQPSQNGQYLLGIFTWS